MEKKGMRNVKNNEKKATTQLHAVVSRECLINILQFPLWLIAVHELSWGPEIDAEDQLNETISSIHPVLNVDVVPQPSSEPEWKFQFNVCFSRWENIFLPPLAQVVGSISSYEKCLLSSLSYRFLRWVQIVCVCRAQLSSGKWKFFVEKFRVFVVVAPQTLSLWYYKMLKMCVREVCTMRWDQKRKNSGKWENEQVTAAAASEEGFFSFLHYFHTLIIVSWTRRKTIFHNWRKEERTEREMEIFQHFILKKLQIFWAYVLNALNISYTWERGWRCVVRSFLWDGEMKWKWQELKIV